jgi:hypothetical protein
MDFSRTYNNYTLAIRTCERRFASNSKCFVTSAFSRSELLGGTLYSAEASLKCGIPTVSDEVEPFHSWFARTKVKMTAIVGNIQ